MALLLMDIEHADELVRRQLRTVAKSPVGVALRVLAGFGVGDELAQKNSNTSIVTAAATAAGRARNHAMIRCSLP